MKSRLVLLLALLLPIAAGAAGEPADLGAQMRALNWHEGPRTENIASKATFKTDESMVFLDEADSRKFLQLTGNLPQSGIFIVLSKSENWWATFSFAASGFVKDNEKIDADALLSGLKSGEAAANEERAKLGIAPLNIDGWYMPPHYDSESKRLEWGLRLSSDGSVSHNYTVRLLGRTGVMSATLVSSPEKTDADLKSFKAALKNFEFDRGERYAEFKSGDRVAEYGLAALVLGGAAAVAAKKGAWAAIVAFLAGAWKLGAGAVVAIGAWLRSLFRKKT